MIEIKDLGNITEDDLYRQPCQDMDEYPESSLADRWTADGIRYEITKPAATAAYTSEQLHAMGFVGVRLLIERPELTD